MADRARVHSIDALSKFRPALVKFIDECAAALVSAEADAGRAVMRIRNEREPYWKKQIRVRQDELNQAKKELAMKQIMKDGDDARPDVDQRKLVEKARRRVAVAEEKHRVCKKWARRLEKEQSDFHAQVGALRRVLETDMPTALAELDRMALALEDYTKIKSPTNRAASSSRGGAAGSRPGGTTQ